MSGNDLPAGLAGKSSTAIYGIAGCDPRPVDDDAICGVGAGAGDGKIAYRLGRDVEGVLATIDNSGHLYATQVAEGNVSRSISKDVAGIVRLPGRGAVVAAGVRANQVVAAIDRIYGVVVGFFLTTAEEST